MTVLVLLIAGVSLIITIIPLSELCLSSQKFWADIGPAIGAESIDQIKSKSKILGKGGFSTAYEISYNNVNVVFKYTLLKDDIDKVNAERELTIIKNFQNVPGVLKLFHCVYEGKNIGVMMEKADISSEAYSKKPGQKRFRERIKIYIEFASLLSFFHSQEIYHNDLKLDNILIVVKGTTRIRLIDYNLSCIGVHKSPGGTHGYNPPEKVPASFNCPCSAAIDVWGFIMTLVRYEDHGNKNYRKDFSFDCFTEEMTQKCYKKLKKNIRAILHRTPKLFKTLVSRGLAFDPKDRPTMQETLTELKVISMTIQGSYLPSFNQGAKSRNPFFISPFYMPAPF